MAKYNLTLLYVEDDETNRNIFTQSFKRKFIEVYSAYDGIDGFEQYEKYKPDLILTDINMPRLSGLGLIEKIREQNKDIPIVIYSAFSEQEKLLKAIELGVTQYLIKPINRIHMNSVIKDVSELIILRKEKKKNEEELKRAYAQINNSFELIDEFIIAAQTDLDGIITYASDAFCKVSKYDREELIGGTFRKLRDPQIDINYYKTLWDKLTKGDTWVGELSNIDKNGNRYWIKSYIKPKYELNGKHIGYTQVSENITHEKLIEKISITDQLTKAYNRHKTVESLHQVFLEYKRYKVESTLIMLDIDFFKKINDTYGHIIGDEVLIRVANKIKENIRETDIFGRWGGEEFLIISTNTNITYGYQLALKLCNVLDNDIKIKDINVTASFGVTQIKDDDKDENVLLNRVDAALYSSKENGRNMVTKID